MSENIGAWKVTYGTVTASNAFKGGALYKENHLSALAVTALRPA
jgi:hypothetical protein